MPSSPKSLSIATRASRLALWQAEYVANRLKNLYPDCAVHLQPMSTRGDEVLDKSLSAVGGKGLFIKELEFALLQGRADLAVHSLKDVPMELDPAFVLAAITEREDPRDALIGCEELATLPAGSVIGTSSLRRQAMVLAGFPHLKVQALRGNLDTRLNKLDSGMYKAIVLAAAGLKRLGYTHRIAKIFPPEEMLPSAGQGALGIEVLTSRQEVRQAVEALADPETTRCSLAERAVSKTLGGSCSMPLAAHAVLQADGKLWLRAWIGVADGTRHIQAQAVQAQAESPEALGERVALLLQEKGAQDLLLS